MKTTGTILGCANREAEMLDFKNFAKYLRSKITDKVCICIASAGVITLVFSLSSFNVPFIVTSGLISLGAVAAAPMNGD